MSLTLFACEIRGPIKGHSADRINGPGGDRTVQMTVGVLLQLHNMPIRRLDKYLMLLALFRCNCLLPGPPGAAARRGVRSRAGIIDSGWGFSDRGFRFGGAVAMVRG
jgi:hypothetical protein